MNDDEDYPRLALLALAHVTKACDDKHKDRLL